MRAATSNAVRRAESDADELYHQGRAGAEPAVGTGHSGSDDGGRARGLRCPVAGIRGRNLPADLDIVADLCRRHRPICSSIFTSNENSRAKNLTEEQIIAETDKSNGVLLASGYIAGGAIAGILIAVFAVVPS